MPNIDGRTILFGPQSSITVNKSITLTAPNYARGILFTIETTGGTGTLGLDLQVSGATFTDPAASTWRTFASFTDVSPGTNVIKILHPDAVIALPATVEVVRGVMVAQGPMRLFVDYATAGAGTWTMSIGAYPLL